MTSDGTNTTRPTTMRALGALAWLVVLGMALATSWWSLYAVARYYGVPAPLAVGFSSIFDGAALILADLQRRYAETEDSGLVPRLLLIGTVVGSVALNRQHAVLLHYNWPGQVAFAAPAAVAIALFEVEMRWRHRRELRKNGRVAEALPPLGRWQWILHPAQSLHTLIAVTRARGAAARRREMARIEARLTADLDRLQRPGQQPAQEQSETGPDDRSLPGLEPADEGGQPASPDRGQDRPEIRWAEPGSDTGQTGGQPASPSPTDTSDDLLLDRLEQLSREAGRMLSRPEAVEAVQTVTGARPGSGRADRLREQAAQRAGVYVQTARKSQSGKSGRARRKVVPMDQSRRAGSDH